MSPVSFSRREIGVLKINNEYSFDMKFLNYILLTFSFVIARNYKGHIFMFSVTVNIYHVKNENIVSAYVVSIYVLYILFVVTCTFFYVELQLLSIVFPKRTRCRFITFPTNFVHVFSYKELL
jgi:hypothetical protein